MKRLGEIGVGLIVVSTACFIVLPASGWYFNQYHAAFDYGSKIVIALIAAWASLDAKPFLERLLASLTLSALVAVNLAYTGAVTMDKMYTTDVLLMILFWVVPFFAISCLRYMPRIGIEARLGDSKTTPRRFSIFSLIAASFLSATLLYAFTIAIPLDLSVTGSYASSFTSAFNWKSYVDVFAVSFAALLCTLIGLNQRKWTRLVFVLIFLLLTIKYVGYVNKLYGSREGLSEGDIAGCIAFVLGAVTTFCLSLSAVQVVRKSRETSESVVASTAQSFTARSSSWIARITSTTGVCTIVVLWLLVSFVSQTAPKHRLHLISHCWYENGSCISIDVADKQAKEVLQSPYFSSATKITLYGTARDDVLQCAVAHASAKSIELSTTPISGQQLLDLASGKNWESIRLISSDEMLDELSSRLDDHEAAKTARRVGLLSFEAEPLTSVSLDKENLNSIHTLFDFDHLVLREVVAWDEVASFIREAHHLGVDTLSIGFNGGSNVSWRGTALSVYNCPTFSDEVLAAIETVTPTTIEFANCYCDKVLVVNDANEEDSLHDFDGTIGWTGTIRTDPKQIKNLHQLTRDCKSFTLTNMTLNRDFVDHYFTSDSVQVRLVVRIGSLDDATLRQLNSKPNVSSIELKVSPYDYVSAEGIDYAELENQLSRIPRLKRLVYSERVPKGFLKRVRQVRPDVKFIEEDNDMK